MPAEETERKISEKMRSAGIDDEESERFLDMVRRREKQASAFVPLDRVSAPTSERILEIGSDPDELIALEESGNDLLSQSVIIKLNGGRSTTMGGEVPKGILTAKDGRSYLDIIAGQVEAFDRLHGVAVPLVLMNSFFTHDQTMEIIKDFRVPIRTFLQSRVPRLLEDTLEPLDTGTEEDWTPPGHGDVYPSLNKSGLLDQLLSEGRRWAFISNLDNLAASLDPRILGLIGRDRISFLMEVTDRTEADRKGGTLVVRDGRLDLLEIAQVADDDKDAFMDIERFRLFNTNSIWVDLEALSAKLRKDRLELPIISNRKRAAGRDVIQLETAMGAAIGSFERARGLRVDRNRFFPTKKVEDLFILQSDICVLDAMDRLQPNPERPDSLPLRPTIEFATDFLSTPLDMDARFEDASTVSLVNAESFEVSGAAYFERDVRIEGRVAIRVPPGEDYRVPKGTVLRDDVFPES